MATRNTQAAILRTLIYFNIYNFPLTRLELEKYLFSENNFSPELQPELDELVESNRIKTLEGFYFLPERANLIEIRKNHYLLAQRKIALAKKSVKLLGRCPFVEAIFVCNDLAYLNSPEDGDIDLTIVAKTGRIWTTRFFTTLLMALLRRRPTQNLRKNKICLSFYVAGNALNIEGLAYANDIHLAYWQMQQLPLYDPRNLAEKLFTVNSWTKKYLPNAFPVSTNDRWLIKRNFVVKKIFEKVFGNALEKFLKKWQLKIMPTALKNKAKEDNPDVVLNDFVLKFHDKDTRQEIQNEWEKRCHNIIRYDQTA